MRKKLIILFLTAFLFRLFLINAAFHGDLYNNLSWGNKAIEGLNGFYEKTGFAYSIPNQPPLYILLFATTSFLFKNINNLIFYLNDKVGIFPSSLVWFWQTNGNVILLKLPGIFADLGIGYLIYHYFAHKNKRQTGFNLAIVWLFNPISWYNSAIWGQTDAIVNFLGLISILYLLKKDLVKSILFFVLSILFKGSLTIFIPILIILWILQKHKMSIWIRALLLSAGATIVFSIWFHPQIDLPIWLFNLYTQRFFPGEIGYLTANAFNLWYLVNPGKVLDNIKYFKIAAHTIGYILALTMGVLIFIKNRKKINQEKTVFLLLAMSALISFLFFTRIHERYLYPFFPVATILNGLIPELIIPYIILSFVFLFNMYNLFWAPSIPFLENIMKTSQLPDILAIINLVVFAFLFFFLRA